jgi:hypothetical protein
VSGPRRHEGRCLSLDRAPPRIRAEPPAAGDGKQRPLVPRSRSSPRLSRSVRHQASNHKRRRQDIHHAARAPQPHRVPTDQPRPEERCAPGHRPCPRAPSVFRPMVSAPGYCRCSRPIQAHGRCSGPWSVPRPMVSTQAHGQCPRPMVSAPGYCRCSRPIQAHGQYPGSLPVLTAHCRYSQPVVSAQAHCRYSQPIVGAHTEKRGTGAQHHALRCRTRVCRRRGTSSAPASLHLFPAPET